MSDCGHGGCSDDDSALLRFWLKRWIQRWISGPKITRQMGLRVKFFNYVPWKAIWNSPYSRLWRGELKTVRWRNRSSAIEAQLRKEREEYSTKVSCFPIAGYRTTVHYVTILSKWKFDAILEENNANELITTSRKRGILEKWARISLESHLAMHIIWPLTYGMLNEMPLCPLGK